MKQDWAREKVVRLPYYPRLGPTEVICLLRAERSRARRIVRALRKTLPHGMDYQGYADACDEILKRLQ